MEIDVIHSEVCISALFTIKFHPFSITLAPKDILFHPVPIVDDFSGSLYIDFKKL